MEKDEKLHLFNEQNKQPLDPHFLRTLESRLKTFRGILVKNHRDNVREAPISDVKVKKKKVIHQGLFRQTKKR